MSITSPVVFKKIEDEYCQALHSLIIGRCLDGECYAFAIAMHRYIGWSMIGLMENGEIRHAVVVDDNGQFWDARGKVDTDELGCPFDISPPYDLKPIEEKDLFAVSPISEMEICLISKIAQAIWPELPWKQDALKSRVISFVEELEELSRKHGFWIYGNLPVSLPIIAEGVGDESGYEIGNTVDGLSYWVNRTLGRS